jgi:hypothetical protein
MVEHLIQTLQYYHYVCLGGSMRILGGILVILGIILSLTIFLAPIGIPMFFIGGLLILFGGRRKTYITNVVTVSNNTSDQGYARAPPREAPISYREVAPVEPSRPAPLLAANIDTQSGGYDQQKWRALIRFDDEISAAAEKVRAMGGEWEDELARSYLQLNDKSYLDLIVKKILSEAQAKKA